MSNDDPRTVCDHADERGSTVMQVREDRYECAVCGERFRLVRAAVPDAERLDVERLVREMRYHEALRGKPDLYRDGWDAATITLLDRVAALASTPDTGHE
jgi:hypothetical protein